MRIIDIQEKTQQSLQKFSSQINDDDFNFLPSSKDQDLLTNYCRIFLIHILNNNTDINELELRIGRCVGEKKHANVIHISNQFPIFNFDTTDIFLFASRFEKEFQEGMPLEEIFAMNMEYISNYGSIKIINADIDETENVL